MLMTDAVRDEAQNFVITIENTGESFKCQSDRHLLSAMSRMGKKGIPSGCQGGGCGVCKIQINSGVYDTKKMSRAHVSADEEASGSVLACRVFPRSDLSLSVIGKLQKNIVKKSTKTPWSTS
jgi:ferredoxin